MFETPEEVHDDIIETIKEAIRKQVRITFRKNYVYNLDRDVAFEIDLIVLLNQHLYIFEIKTGIRERKARKQLQIHKSGLKLLQNKLSAKGLFFSEIKTFWVSWKEEKVVNTITNKETHLAEFLNNPLPFLLK